MEQNVFKEKLADINNTASKLRNGLMHEFVLDIARFKVGDLIKCTRSHNIIKVERILYRSPDSFGNRTDYPIPVYSGRKYTLRLKPRKDGVRGQVDDNTAIMV